MQSDSGVLNVATEAGFPQDNYTQRQSNQNFKLIPLKIMVIQVGDGDTGRCTREAWSHPSESTGTISSWYLP